MKLIKDRSRLCLMISGAILVLALVLGAWLLLSVVLTWSVAQDMYNQLDHHSFTHGRGAKALIPSQGFIALNAGFKLLKLLRLSLEQMSAVSVSNVKAIHKLGIGQHMLKILPVKVNDNALIGQCFVYLGLVYGVMFDQQHIPGLELIARAFNPVVNAPGDKNNQLVKVVKMKIQLLPGSITQMKVMVAFFKISGFIYAF